MSAALIEAAKAVSEKINQIHKAFGAPGDYGYGTKEGDALFELYHAQAALLGEIKKSEKQDD